MIAVVVAALVLVAALVGSSSAMQFMRMPPSFAQVDRAAAALDPPFLQPLPGVRTEVVFNSSGTDRAFVVYVPSSVTAQQPAPLVFSFHGWTSTPRQQELLSFFSALAEEYGFIAVYPEGVSRSFNSGPSCCPPAFPDVDDVENALNIIDHVDSAIHPVNRSRIYSSGMSNGGFMSTRLACDAADVFAAVASVTGASPWGDAFLSNCHPVRPVPYLHFHGTADPTVPYEDAELVVDGWLTLDGCNKNTFVQTYNYGDSSCVAYTAGCSAHGGNGATNVTFCSVDGGLHAWPGNPVYQDGTLDLYASPHIIDFFFRYSL